MFEHLNRPFKLMMTLDEVLNTKLTIKDLKNKTQNGGSRQCLRTTLNRIVRRVKVSSNSLKKLPLTLLEVQRQKKSKKNRSTLQFNYKSYN